MTEGEGKKWKARFEWLASQHWVEEEVSFRLDLPNDEYLDQYLTSLTVSIDSKLEGANK